MEPIDEFLPAFQFRERHQRRLAASPARACAELRDVDLARSPFVGPLFAIRGLTARASRLWPRIGGDAPAAAAPAALRAGRLGDLFDEAFVTLRSDPARGLVVGAVGASCLAVTETRIDCNDVAARRAMQLYWLAIRPVSGLIRREMLRLLALRCSDPLPPR
jgi:hypothetical protein